MLNLTGITYIKVKARNAKKYKGIVADNIPIIAQRQGLAVHLSTNALAWQGHKDQSKEYRVSHIASGAAIVPKHFDYKAEAIRLMNAACTLDVDWTMSYDDLVAATKGKGVAGELDRLCRECARR